MTYQEDLDCPQCQSKDLDAVPYIYQSLLSRGAGKDLFTQSPLVQTTILSQHQRERLIHRLTPPKTPKKHLPARAIALMAFLVSWLITGSLLIGKLGYMLYLIISVIVIIGTAVPFIIIIRVVERDFQKTIHKYNRLKPVWNKQYICNECHHIFIPAIRKKKKKRFR